MSAFTYFYTWAQSNMLEWFIYLPALSYWLKQSKTKSPAPNWLFVSVCNAITHPIVFFVFMASSLNFKQAILSAESFAVLAETTLIYFFFPARIPLGQVLLVSLLANLLSWQVAPYLSYALIQVLY